MIARLFVLLPFNLTVPDGEQFNIFQYEDSGYKVRVYPPTRSERAPAIDGPQQLKIDGVPAFQVDVLWIDFIKESFDRHSGSPCDPSEEFMKRAVNSFLIRLRHVCNAPQVRPLNFPFVPWRLQYLNDDETELVKDEKLVRGHGTIQLKFTLIVLNNKVWNDIHKLPVNYEATPWESLLLDARGELPSIGPSIVLASTALEVFIAKILDKLATRKNTPPELWKWINERGDWLRQPTLEEQYDFLLKFLTGHSLKEDQVLWDAFKNLKTARNSFVHEGIAKVGGAPLNVEVAGKLVASATLIIQKIREWVPEELHWPQFKYEFKVEASQQIR
ncbi:MAG: hypothetical protein MN733_39200 [Nitrososphaera sp.]|nr:hypothetical protein [Nitrososphaera sp.]